MWKRKDRAEIKRMITKAKAQGSPFESGRFRLDCPEYVELICFSLTAFPRLFAYAEELEAACKSAGITTSTMKQVKNRSTMV